VKIYLVLHHEIMQRGRNHYFADDVVLHVASSPRKALAHVRSTSVAPFSWWEIQEQTVDDEEWPTHLGWYGRRGGKLKHPPFARAVEVYKRCRADPNHHLNL
jgi:hypothetical protein